MPSDHGLGGVLLCVLYSGEWGSVADFVMAVLMELKSAVSVMVSHKGNANYCMPDQERI